MVKLEDLRLVKRLLDQPPRPPLVVLRDDGSQGPFDDPDGAGRNSYITISGAIIASSELREWSAAEVAFYLVAMVGERHENDRRRRHGVRSDHNPELGAGEWFQTLNWFSGESGYRPKSHVMIPFSTPTLERGLREFKRKGLVQVVSATKDPLTGDRFRVGKRNVYHNKFATLDAVAGVLPLTDAQLIETIEQIESGTRGSR